MPKHIEDKIRYGLSRPPSRAGLRLRSADELAPVFGVDRMRIHRIMSKLAREGVVVRRDGSGTFVRKALEWNFDSDADWVQDAKQLAQELFAPSDSGRRIPDQERQLRLSLWSDFHCTTETNRLLMEGVVQRAKEEGHSLAIHSLVQEEDQPLAANDVAAQLGDTPCDGYLVVTRWASRFEESLARAFGEKVLPPMAYVEPGSSHCRCQPLIELDLQSAVRRAVDLFAEEGCRRIGFIQLQSPAHDERLDAQVYDSVCSQHGFDYRAVECATSDGDSVTRAMSRMFDRDEAPDAVYVGDDHLMLDVADYLQEHRRTPGRDIGVIVLSNRGIALPEGVAWSRLEFNPVALGRLAVENLLRVISTAGEELCSLAQRPIWLPGTTHKNAQLG